MAKKKLTKRPILVTIFCILGFIGVPSSILFALLGISAVSLALNFTPMPAWYSIFGIVLALLYLASLIYIWKMRKIGLITHTILAIIDFTVGFAFGFADIWGLLISIIVIGLLYTQFNKMK